MKKEGRSKSRSFSLLFHRLLAIILIFSIISGMIAMAPLAAFAAATNTDQEDVSVPRVQHHTADEIRAYAQAHPIHFVTPSYEEEPSFDEDSQLTGILSEETRQDALNTINQIRYIAGLSGVTQNEYYSRDTQAACYVSIANRTLSHYPNQPQGVDTDIYEMGRIGASHSNLAAGISNLSFGILYGWMAEVQHRRWCISPFLGETGFGYLKKGSALQVSAMYVMDYSNQGTEASYDSMWPAENMPYEYFSNSDYWTFSTGNVESYQDVKVTLINIDTGKTWYFSSEESGYDQFYVNNEEAGQQGCIIFRPEPMEVDYTLGQKYQVTITGTSRGTIQYTVNFFNLFHKINKSTEGSGTFDMAREADSYLLRAYTARAGETVTIETSPASGYETAQVLVNGKEVDKAGWNQYTFQMPDQDVTVQVNFSKIKEQHSTSISSNNNHGTCTVSAAQAEEGDEVTVTVSPEEGYTVKSVSAEGITLVPVTGKEGTYTFTMPASSVHVYVEFEQIPVQTWHVTVQEAAYGTITVSNKEPAKGETVHIDAVPDDGYITSEVLVSGVTVSRLSENAYQFIMPAQDVTVQVIFQKIPPAKVEDFTDVATGAWYEEAIRWAVSQGVASGTDQAHFGVGQDCYREQIITFLYKACGSPAVTDFRKIAAFTDVKPGAYYYNAVAWAVNNGITSGFDKTHFGIGKSCTRAQAVTFIWIAMGKPAAAASSSFSDVANGKWYTSSVNWAVSVQVTSGIGNGKFGVNQACKREQIVTFIYKAFAD